jgi:hypothetical protein
MSSEKILYMIKEFLQEMYQLLILDCVNSIEDQLQEESSLMEERNSTDYLH